MFRKFFDLRQVTSTKCLNFDALFSSLFHLRTFSSRESFEVKKTHDEWKSELGKERYKVLRLKGTEPPFQGEYVHLSIKITIWSQFQLIFSANWYCFWFFCLSVRF